MTGISAPRPERRLPSVRTDAEAWELVEQNTRLVRWVIGRWFRHLGHDDRDDAYGFGVEGLFRAAQLWQPHRGTFSTYAKAWVHQRIQRGMSDVNDRRAQAEGQPDPDRPLSLDVTYGNDDGENVSLAHFIHAADSPAADAEWSATIAGVAARCANERERAILAAVARGDWSIDDRLAVNFGVSRETIRRDRYKVRHLLASEYGGAYDCAVDGCTLAPMTAGMCSRHYRAQARDLASA